MTPNFEKFINRLTRMNKQRPSPGDFIYNLAEIAADLKFTQEEWTNFYIYVTLQDKDEFEWKPAGTVETLGDIADEELIALNEELVQPGCDVRKNGIETTVMVKNMENLVLNKTNGKFVAKAPIRLS